MSRKTKTRSLTILLIIAILAVIAVLFLRIEDRRTVDDLDKILEDVDSFEFLVHGQEIPEYFGKPYVTVNGDVPFFTEDEIVELGSLEHFEEYNYLDSLGRATGAFALVSQDTIPDYDREELQYKPSGWLQNNYEFIDNGGWLYNRCHLIGFILTGQQDNPNNLITGTRQFNLAMTPFESQVLQYISYYNSHVLYRVTPYYEGDDLVAAGVLMEAYSVEHPDEASFCVFVYNVQDRVTIDYETGDNQEY